MINNAINNAINTQSNQNEKPEANASGFLLFNRGL